MDPGERSQRWMGMISAVMMVAGLTLGTFAAAWHGNNVILTLTPSKVLRTSLATVGFTALTMVLHEALHGLGMLACGARPRFGAGVMHTGLPYLFTTSEGHLFTRAQCLVIAALPNLLVNSALALLLLWGPHPSWWVVPLAFHLSGCVGDAWLCWAAAHERPGTLIEDLRGGVRVHRLEVRPDRPGADPAS